MDYKKIYDELIDCRRTNIPNGYTENHHIQMRSLGGSDDESNLVRLSGREHYIAHLLLARFNPCSQTVYALWMMQCKSEERELSPHIKNSRMYEWARKEFAKYVSRNNKITSKGERNSQFGTCWICNIELKENKKISKDSKIPEGWIIGRSLWNKKYQPKRGSYELRMILREKALGRLHSTESKLKMSKNAILSGRNSGVNNGMYKSKIKRLGIGSAF